MSKLRYEEKMGNNKVVVRPFEDSDAEGLAKLFNESEEGWPGGFTGGAVYTAERVLEKVKRTYCLVYFVISFNRQIIGVCQVSEHAKDKKVAYISFLNLHPEYHGRGLGRRLLFQAVKYAIESGFERIEIDTWSGNLKAVPLYKKMGFFWVPGTQVHMQNYVPAVLNHPLCERFFKKHPDWYGNFQRVLKVEEDAMKARGMKVFVYQWSKDGDNLKVTVDREGFSIAGIEDNQVSVMCWPSEHDAPAGFPQKVSWQIKNKTEKRINCSLQVSSEEDIVVAKSPPEAFPVEPAQTVTLEGEVKIAPNPKKKEENDPAHKIKTSLFIDESSVPLTIGIRIKQPVEFLFDPQYFSGCPGSEGELKVTLKNNVNQPIEGVLSAVLHPGFTLNSLSQPFKLAEEGYAGATFNIKISEVTGTAVMPLRFYTTIKAENNEIKTAEKEYPIRAFTPGGVLATTENDGELLVLENEVARVVIRLHKGGRLLTFHGKLFETHYVCSLFDAVGPPFWPRETFRKDFKHELFRENGCIRARLYADLEAYEGLRIIKDVTLFPSTELVKIQYSFVNSSSTAKHDFQLRMATWGNRNEARIVVPQKGGILSAIANGDFPHRSVDLPQKPEEFSETWFCLEYPMTDEVAGVLWHPEGVLENRNGTRELILKPEVVAPHSSVALKPMYLVGGFGTWRKVRELWRRLVCGQTRKEVTYQRLVAQPLIEIAVKPSVMDEVGEVEAKLVVTHRRGKMLSGELTVNPPEDWTIKPQKIKIKDVNLKNQYKKTVVFSPKKKLRPGAFSGNVKISSQLTTIERPFHLVFLGEKGTVKIEKTKKENKETFCVDNGRLLLKVCPRLAGTVYSLVDKETGVDHLMSAFPERKPYGYQNPWFGGMRFGVWKDRRYEKLYDEVFQCVEAERNGWVGVKVCVKPEEHVKDLRGIALEGFYLTRPGSNVIARILRIENLTSARMMFTAYQNAFVQAGGSITNNVAYFKKGQEVLTRKRVRRMAWIAADENWLQVTNAKTDDSLFMISTLTERSRPVLQDLGLLGVSLSMTTDVLVDPEKPLELLSYLVLAKGADVYKAYKVLGDYVFSCPT